MMLTLILSLLLTTLSTLAEAAQTPLHSTQDSNASRHLHLTAVVSAPSPPHHAKFECWEMHNPFISYPTIGSSLSLANISNLTLVTLPPRSKEPLHHPPHPMFFILLSGTSHVRLPADPQGDGLWIKEGSIIVANDMEGIGHWTDYPGDGGAVALQAPFEGGIVPEHRVVSDGICDDDTVGDGRG